MYQLIRTCSRLQSFPIFFKSTLPSLTNRIKFEDHLTRVTRTLHQSLASGYATKSFDQKPGSIDNEVLVYEYENPKFFRRIKYLSVAQALIWSFMGKSLYDWISEVPEKEDDSIIVTPSTMRGIIISFCIAGFATLFLVWWFISRNIRQITFIKNKKMVRLHTYNPLINKRVLTLPLDDVSGVVSRHVVKGYIPLKLKGTIFYFLVSTDGQLKNSHLFDNAIALKRKFEDKK